MRQNPQVTSVMPAKPIPCVMVPYSRDEGYRRLHDGIELQNLVHGDETMMIQVRLERGSHLPRHSHPHEQTGYLLSGSLRFTIGDEVYMLGGGDTWCIPGGVPHEVDALEDTVVVEVFAPPREDYLEGSTRKP